VTMQEALSDAREDCWAGQGSRASPTVAMTGPCKVNRRRTQAGNQKVCR
jgi:hypothetical protein